MEGAHPIGLSAK